jgi:glycosidase
LSDLYYIMPPRYPSLYQINTRIWLHELGPATTLDDVPDADLDQLADRGFDWLWPLGVWQTGPVGREISRTHPQLRPGYAALLPDFREEDVCGSPFAIRAYTVHEDFGGDDALGRLRSRLHDRGLRLLLDFVPNHTALDHAWVWAYPEYYVHGSEDDLAREPGNYCRIETSRGPAILAHGRDPYFPGWTDTLQLNYRHAGLRQALTEQLIQVAERCDGVRCDMAMLLLPDVIARTWGDRSRPADGTASVDDPFWPAAIAAVRETEPAFVLLAEVYWDREWELLQQGFHYAYDKRLYDRLRRGDAEGVRAHLAAGLDYQDRMARFLENHDEARATSAFPDGRHPAAALLTYLVPGLRFFHEGQLEGRRAHADLHLRRRPAEPLNPDLRAFYARLLETLQREEVRAGCWRLLECWPEWEDNPTWKHFIAFSWDHEASGARLLGVVNYGPTPGQCFVRLPWPDLRGRNLFLRDLLGSAEYERGGGELTERGLYLNLPAWGFHLFEVS